MSQATSMPTLLSGGSDLSEHTILGDSVSYL